MKSAAIVPALSTIIAALISAAVTWLVMRRQFASKRLVYSFSIQPLLSFTDADLSRDLQVLYKGELLPSPTLLDIEIANVGLAAVEDAKVVIALPGSTYLIPGYFVDVPPGYSDLWDVERSDAEECTLHFKHINPKQVARLRLLMDEIPHLEPNFSCPMPNVSLTGSNKTKTSTFTKLVTEILVAQLQSTLSR